MSVQSDIRRAVTIDFETERIENRPDFPPKPVGVAIRYPDGVSEYLAWGHPSGNNTDLSHAKRKLQLLWRNNIPLLFFNAKFDLAVAYEKLGLSELPWDRVHDAMFLAFLADPHSRNLELKSLAEDLLDWEPEEQNAVAGWVWAHRKALVAEYGGKVTRAKKGPYSAGAWISKCPAELIGPYAIGDVDRTFGLFEHIYPKIQDYGMLPAYARERQILPIFMENERDGMNVDLPRLEKTVPRLQKSLLRADKHLRRLLGTPDLNIDADAQLADALSHAGVVLDDDWTLTPTGQRSVSKVNLTFDMFQDPDIAHLFFYRNRLMTGLGTFLEPWLEQARKTDGIITTNWHQTRGGEGGTRTGRPSTSNHNFLNIAKKFDDEYDMPKGNVWKLSPLPFVRKFVLPDPGEVFLHRDFDTQEMRIFAHFEDGELLEAYQDNPKLDPHQWVSDMIFEMLGVELDRVPTKALNFLGLYGGGAPAAARELKCTLAEAKEFKGFHDKALPGRAHLNSIIKELIDAGEPIRTWGGRVYFQEPSRVIHGRMMNFIYKLINYLCQGSAADITKESIIRWYNHPKRNARFLVSVYDETNISGAERDAKRQMRILMESMESVKLDCQMTTSGKMGPNWGSLLKCA